MIYSGNLNDYKDALERLKEERNVTVTMETFSYADPARLRTVRGEVIRVLTASGHPVATRTFEHSDSDVQINAQTEWLRKVHCDLKHWQ